MVPKAAVKLLSHEASILFVGAANHAFSTVPRGVEDTGLLEHAKKVEARIRGVTSDSVLRDSPDY